MNDKSSAPPILPRRAFIAAGLSAALAGSLVGLGFLGQATLARSETFQFSRGLAFAAGEEARLRAYLASALADERVHVAIVGHTGEAGDLAANLALSEERAALAAAMATEMGVDLARISQAGVGGAAPLPKASEEGDRAHQSRLARVEVSLQVRR
ncbi:MAG: OmpA family protein [Pseudomonadota bacterium]